MFNNLTRRDFIKTAALGLLAVNTVVILPENAFAADSCTVKTRYGTFNGFIDENGIKTWLGIPFAQPPVGKLRWQAPQPLKPTNKTFDAKEFGLPAFQIFEEEIANIIPSEDCLTLNIFTHGEGKNKPVMVWIHGGGFSVGGSIESTYNGSNFAAENDVVLVTINYRLNIFGFLNLASIDSAYEDSGYLGIKDQIAALQWIKENIEEFGGNPDNITIFGQSAGSISCMLLTVTPAAKNLFCKAIPQSGHIGFYNTPEESAKVAEIFMEMSGAKKMGDLMKKSSDEIKNIYLKLSESRGLSLGDYFPTCDGKFLPKNPLQALKNGAARGIKFLTGNTADEWRCFLMADEKLFEHFRAEPEKVRQSFQATKNKRTKKFIRNGLKIVQIPMILTATLRRKLIGASDRKLRRNINRNLKTFTSICSVNCLRLKFCARVTRLTCRLPSIIRKCFIRIRRRIL